MINTVDFSIVSCPNCFIIHIINSNDEITRLGELIFEVKKGKLREKKDEKEEISI